MRKGGLCVKGRCLWSSASPRSRSPLPVGWCRSRARLGGSRGSANSRGGPRPEIRRPTPEGYPSSETRCGVSTCRRGWTFRSPFGLRPSFGSRVSDFGLPTELHAAPGTNPSPGIHPGIRFARAAGDPGVTAEEPMAGAGLARLERQHDGLESLHRPLRPRARAHAREGRCGAPRVGRHRRKPRGHADRRGGRSYGRATGHPRRRRTHRRVLPSGSGVSVVARRREAGQDLEAVREVGVKR